MLSQIGLVLLVVLPVSEKLHTQNSDAAMEQIIRALGGSVIRDDQTENHPIVAVTLSLTTVTDAHLECLRGLPNLQSLRLTDSQITNDGLKHLKKFPNLVELYLSSTQVTDAGLQELRDQEQYETLMALVGVGNLFHIGED